MTGLLLVYSEPGSAISLDEFNNWYDNEHPSYLSIYNIDSPDSINEPPYSALASTRSARETSIIDRLALFDRRTYSLHEPVRAPAQAEYDVCKPGPYLSAIVMDIPDEHVAEFNTWYDTEHIPLFAKTPGWVRTRCFVLADAAARGIDDSLKPVGSRPQRFIALYEWEAPEASESEEYKAATSTWCMLKLKGITQRFERRAFRLWRSRERDAA